MHIRGFTILQLLTKHAFSAHMQLFVAGHGLQKIYRK